VFHVTRAKHVLDGEAGQRRVGGFGVAAAPVEVRLGDVDDGLERLALAVGQHVLGRDGGELALGDVVGVVVDVVEPHLRADDGEYDRALERLLDLEARVAVHLEHPVVDDAHAVVLGGEVREVEFGVGERVVVVGHRAVLVLGLDRLPRRLWCEFRSRPVHVRAVVVALAHVRVSARIRTHSRPRSRTRVRPRIRTRVRVSVVADGRRQQRAEPLVLGLVGLAHLDRVVVRRPDAVGVLGEAGRNPLFETRLGHRGDPAPVDVRLQVDDEVLELVVVDGVAHVAVEQRRDDERRHLAGVSDERSGVTVRAPSVCRPVRTAAGCRQRQPPSRPGGLVRDGVVPSLRARPGLSEEVSERELGRQRQLRLVPELRVVDAERLAQGRFDVAVQRRQYLLHRVVDPRLEAERPVVEGARLGVVSQDGPLCGRNEVTGGDPAGHPGDHTAVGHRASPGRVRCGVAVVIPALARGTGLKVVIADRPVSTSRNPQDAATPQHRVRFHASPRRTRMSADSDVGDGNDRG
jgi:hypothetical protein